MAARLPPIHKIPGRQSRSPRYKPILPTLSPRGTPSAIANRITPAYRNCPSPPPARANLLQRSRRRRKKRGVIQNVRGGIRLGPRAQYHDDQLFPWIDVHVLAENSDGLKRSLMNRIARGNRPPEIAIVHRLPANHVRGARFSEPAFGHSPFALNHAILLHEQSESAVIAQRGAQPATGKPHSAR